MSAYDFALILHLVGVITVFSGMAIAAAALASGRRRDRARDVALLLGLTRVGVAAVGVGVLVVLATGFWLLVETPFAVDEGWVALALLLLALAALLGALGGQRPKRARLLAARLAGQDDSVTPELHRLLRDRVSGLANWTASAAMLGALVLMVWKPDF